MDGRITDNVRPSHASAGRGFPVLGGVSTKLASPRQEVPRRAAAVFPAETLPEDTEVDPYEALPDKLLLLLVQATTGGKLRVQGLDREGKTLDWTSNGMPSLGLAHVLKETDFNPGDVRRYLDIWSQERNELRVWLAERQVSGRAGQVVIVDTTQSEVPWEALLLDDPATGTGRRLGSALPVTRWLPLKQVGFTPSLAASARPNGKILGYFDGTMAETAGSAEKFGLRLLAGPHDDADHFMLQLKATNDDVRLVYLMGHRTGDLNLLKSKLGTLRLLDLYDLEMRVFGGGGVIVFVNACRGALLTAEAHYGDGSCKGFVDVFLKNEAAGVIGPTVDVDSVFAATTAHRILELADSNEDLTVPDILRLIRAEHDSAPGTTPDEESAYRWYYAFGYVYYGDPFAKISLVGARR